MKSLYIIIQFLQQKWLRLSRVLVKTSNIAQFLKPKNLRGKCRCININNITVISVVKRDNFAPQLSNCGLRHAILKKNSKINKTGNGKWKWKKKNNWKKRNKSRNKERFVKTISKLWTKRLKSTDVTLIVNANFVSRNSLEAYCFKQKSIMKAPQQEFPSKMLPKLVLTFTSVDSRIFLWTHSKERKSLISHTTEL